MRNESSFFFFIRKVNAGGCTKKYKSTPFKHPRCDARRVYTLSMHTPSRELIYRLYREVIYIFVIKAPHIFWLQCHPQATNTKSLCGLVAPKNHTTISLEFQYTAAQHVVIFGPTRSLRSSHIHFVAANAMPATTRCSADDS